MKLTAMMMVGPGEQDRYLDPCLDHLLQFCDEIRVRSEDPSIAWPGNVGVEVLMSPPTFFQHEGRARQELLDWACEGKPTHLLAIDADEFVADGQALRRALEQPTHTGVWKLEMTEIWGASEGALNVRWDKAWKPRPCGIVFQVPEDKHSNRQKRRHWRMQDKALACGRVPILTAMASNRTIAPPVTQILHLGWACKADRAERYRRYEVHDGGVHHKSDHLQSIMWDDDRVEIRQQPWPQELDKERLLARVNRT